MLLKLKKLVLISLSLSMFLLMSLSLVHANESVIEPYSIDTYTITRRYKLKAGSGDNGNIDIKLTIDRNIQARTSRLVNVTVTPDFNPMRPLLMSISTTSTPSTGSLISNNNVKVHFKYGVRFIGPSWTEDILINL